MKPRTALPLSPGLSHALKRFAPNPIAALAVDPRGGTRWEVEDVVSHQPCSRIGQPKKYLVRYKGFPASFDEWKSPKDVTRVLIDEYKALLDRALGDGSRSKKAAARRSQRSR
jgi:hypothetical protein